MATIQLEDSFTGHQGQRNSAALKLPDEGDCQRLPVSAFRKLTEASAERN